MGMGYQFRKIVKEENEIEFNRSEYYWKSMKY